MFNLPKLPLRRRFSRLRRSAAYLVVLIGFFVWVITGLRQVPGITLVAAAAAYVAVGVLEQLAIELRSDDPPTRLEE